MLFSQRIVSAVAFESLFSVDSTSAAHLKGRAIVSHFGSTRSGGKWTCSKDRNSTTCYHIREAAKLLPEDFGDLLDTVEVPEALVTKDICSLCAFSPHLSVNRAHELTARGPGTTVSYLPVLPPKWALLPSDEKLYDRCKPIRDGSEYIFRLDSESACLCPNGTRTLYDPSQPTTLRTCKLYTLGTIIEVQVEIQKCPKCPPKRRRYVGPDLRCRGVFNFNNSILATHELLDSYTSAYTTSETPFISWVTQTARIYANVDSVFMGSDLFRSVWFAYVYLQNFVDDMRCKLCGDTPETTIWDGITLAFGKQQLRDSLCPPTIAHPESIVRSKVGYQPHQQLLKDRTLRKKVRDALHGPSVQLVMDSARQAESSMDAGPPTPDPGPARSASIDPFIVQSPQAGVVPSLFPIPISSSSPFPTTPTRPRTTALRPSNSLASLPPSTPGQLGPVTPTPFSPSKALLKHVSSVEQHLARLEACIKELRIECPALATVFEKYVGPAVYAKGRQCPSLWRSFFKQVRTHHICTDLGCHVNVSSQIAAEESVVQLVNWAGWMDLVAYIENPVSENRSRLLSVPIFFRLLSENTSDGSLVLEIMKWVEIQTRQTLMKLMVEPEVLPLASKDTLPAFSDWRKVCM